MINRTNAIVLSCFPRRDGKWTIHLREDGSKGPIELVSDHPAEARARVRVEGKAIVGGGGG